jgi:hypothetical protein
MATENLEKKYQTILEYADMLTEHTLENIEDLSESTDSNFAALVLHASVMHMLLMNCKLEYERRGYKDLEEIVGGISDAVRKALTDCKPTAH